MELCNQMKKYRTEAGLSQDALAEKIFVSRQTISNWETGKNYPDINSLLRMSEVFGVSVDALLKGDVEEIKEMINKEDQREFDRLGRVFSVLLFLMIVTPIPLAKLFRFWGLGIWICFAAVTLAVAMVVAVLMVVAAAAVVVFMAMIVAAVVVAAVVFMFFVVMFVIVFVAHIVPPFLPLLLVYVVQALAQD